MVRRIGVGPVFVVGCVLFPASLLLVPLAGGPHALVLAALLGAEFGAGLGVVMLDMSIGSIFAAAAPDRFRSRVSGAYMVVNYGVRPLGSLAGGALATAIGTRETLWIAAAGGCLAALWLLRSPLMRMRDLPEAAEAEPAGRGEPSGETAAEGAEEGAPAGEVCRPDWRSLMAPSLAPSRAPTRVPTKAQTPNVHTPPPPQHRGMDHDRADTGPCGDADLGAMVAVTRSRHASRGDAAAQAF